MAKTTPAQRTNAAKKAAKDKAAADQATKSKATTDQAAKDQSGDVVAISVFEQAFAFSAPRAGYPVEPARAQELWDENECDALPPKLAVAVFDGLLQQGAKITQHLLTKVAAESIEDEIDAVQTLLGWRLRRYAHTGNAATKMLEWSRHVLALQAFILVELKSPN